MLTTSLAQVSSKQAGRSLACLALTLALVSGSGTSTPANAAKLQGQVEETGILPTTQKPSTPKEAMPVPVLKPLKTETAAGEELFGAGIADKLYGKARQNGLSGQADRQGNGTPGAARLDSKTKRLQGSATSSSLQGTAAAAGDPDAGDKELMIEWDRWRNRFLHAIQSGLQEALNNPSEDTIKWDPARRAMVTKFPMGTIAWFSCQITPDLRVLHIKLVHSSGYPAYDKAVLEAIDALQGSSLLHYPHGSKRPIVTQIAGVKTAEQTEYRNFHFGDVERQRIPSGGGF